MNQKSVFLIESKKKYIHSQFNDIFTAPNDYESSSYSLLPRINANEPLKQAKRKFPENFAYVFLLLE